jgi:hypothetical protein
VSLARWYARALWIAGLASALAAAELARAADADSAYRIVLRSREAQATPQQSKTSQTGGGSIVVDQPTPNTVVIRMGGSAAAGSTFHCSSSGINFALLQDLEVIPTREGLRPPRIGMMGRLVGTLTVTDPEKWQHADGSASQGPATAGALVLREHDPFDRHACRWRRLRAATGDQQSIGPLRSPRGRRLLSPHFELPGGGEPGERDLASPIRGGRLRPCAATRRVLG